MQPDRLDVMMIACNGMHDQNLRGLILQSDVSTRVGGHVDSAFFFSCMFGDPTDDGAKKLHISLVLSLAIQNHKESLPILKYIKSLCNCNLV